MGLHLNYELRLRENTPVVEVDRLLTALHAHARTLPFSEISDVAHAKPEQGKNRRWLEFWASLIARPHPEDIPPTSGDTSTARGFLVHPGQGCETATFGFLFRSDEAGTLREWFWYSQCKTQYASTISDAHLIACHTSLVSVLDFAISLGIDVTVRDETHYWETRDEKRLIHEVAAMNRIVAALAGRLADAIGDAHDVQAPIFEHPRFERLEMGETE